MREIIVKVNGEIVGQVEATASEIQAYESAGFTCILA
jgi:hypothetical protein